ncbi:MAG: arabinogalactan endo-1,4-beta-galactosidase [Crenarchaeota archaeon]|nr:arabinogalactan endo-1,4-beta-galactosidase [Thermoproteota archaeon]
MFLNGIDSNYAPLMEELGFRWKTESGVEIDDILSFFKGLGVNCIRLRIWFGDSGPSRLPYASRLAEKALGVGMRIQPTIFLSDSWADLFKQPAPATWASLQFETRLKLVASYISRVAECMKNLEDDCAYYQIGNEIDYGICGVFAGRKHRRMRKSIDWLRRNIWLKEALILKEAIKTLRAYSGKPVALHLGKSWDLVLLESFILTMNELNVDYEIICFSFYSSGMGLSLDHLKSLKTLGDRNSKAVAIAEYAYPCKIPGGQFWFMNKPSPGYPLTVEGQALWIKNFLKHCLELGFLGAFYWSPELYLTKEMVKQVNMPLEMPLNFGWGPMSLFDEDGKARQAVNSLKYGSPYA